MLTLALLLLLAQDSVDKLVEKLGGTLEERDTAQAELARRGREGLKALEEAALRGATPEIRRRGREALEKIAGGKVLPMDTVRATNVTLPKAARKLGALLADLKGATKLEIDLEGGKGAEIELPESEYRDTPLDVVLAAAARRVGAIWFIAGDRILFAAPGNLAVRIFDVMDLTWGTADDAALSMGSRRADPAPADASQRLTGDDLAHLVKSEAKDDWDEADGKSLCFNNGLLIARNSTAVLSKVETLLDEWRRKVLVRVRLELEAWALESGTDVDADGARKKGKLVALFDRTVVDKRRAALSSLSRLVLATEIDEESRPKLTTFESGVKINVRAALSEDRSSMRVEVEAGFVRLLSVDKRKVGDHEVHVPAFAEHVLRATERVEPGRRVVLGRLGGTKFEEGRPDLVLVGRFTLIEGR
jgi:hypothetical protein